VKAKHYEVEGVLVQTFSRKMAGLFEKYKAKKISKKEYNRRIRKLRVRG